MKTGNSEKNPEMMMVYKIAMAFLLLFTSRDILFGQAVTIVQDSPLTVTHYTNIFEKTKETAKQALKQANYLVKIFKNQAKMIQALNRADWKGAVLGMEYANRSVQNFNQFITDMGAIEGLEEMTESLNFQEMKNKSQELSEIMASTTELMWSTDDFVQAMEYRADQGEYIMQKSRNTDSFVAQMDLLEQRLSLIQGGIDDVARLHLAQNRFLAAQRAEERHEELMADELHRQFSEGTDWEYEGKYTREDYEDAVYGRNFMRAWNAAKKKNRLFFNPERREERQEQRETRQEERRQERDEISE